MTTVEFLQRVGFAIAIPLMGFAVYVNGAEPEPPSTIRDIVIPVVTVEPVEQEEPEPSQDPENEMELLARCIEAEAGNQSVLGRRLVTDVILNRVDSPGYPNTIRDVIYQPGQFAVVKNGAIDEVVPSAETWEAISRELVNRIDNTILFFQAGYYGPYGEPWEQVGGHWFSTGG